MNLINHVVVVGLGGGSGCGKSTLVHELKRIDPFAITELSLDRYYHNLSQYSLDEREKFNFDHPQALDEDLLFTQLRQLSLGYPVEAPIYDFATHTRMGTELLDPGDLILVEGTLLFALPKIEECMDVRVFLDAPDDIRLLRRIERDMRERGRTLDYIAWQYVEMVRPMYKRYIEPYKANADFLLDGMNTVSSLAGDFLKKIAPLVRKPGCKPCSNDG